MQTHRNFRLLTVIAILLISAFAIEQLPYKRTDIDGSYIVSEIGPDVPTQLITLRLENGNIFIDGCNQLSSPYSYDLTSQSLRVKDFVTTFRACQFDQDRLVTDAFKASFRVYKNDAGALIVQDGQGHLLLKAEGGRVIVSETTTVKSELPSVQTKTNTEKKIVRTEVITTITSSTYTTTQISQTRRFAFGFVYGKYDFSIPAIELTMNQNGYTLTGCNSHQIAVQGSGQRVQFSVTGSTRKACQIDFDQLYLQAFSRGRILLTVSTGYRVLDENSKLLLEFVAQKSENYLVSVPSVVLTIDDETISFEGCNIYTISYKILPNNGIQFGKFFSTKRFCLFFDYDQYIFRSIQLATSYNIVQKSFMLKFGQNIVGIALPKVQGQVINNALPSGKPQNNAVPVPVPIPVEPINLNPFDPYATTPIYQNLTPILPPTPESQIPLVVVSTPTVIPEPITTTVPIVVQVPQIQIPIVVPTPICTPVAPTDPQTFIPPVVVIPNVVPTSLRGTYRIQFLQTDLQPIILTFDDEYIQFEGCNIQRFPYAAYTDGLFAVLSGGSATRRECDGDRDSEYIRIIKNVNRFTKTQLGYAFSQNDRYVFNLNYRIRNQIVTYNMINGAYQMQIPRINSIVSDSQISFNGCNSNGIPFTLTGNGNIQFGTPISTLMYCVNDMDGVYVKAIINGVQLKQIPEGYALVDKKGFETIRFISLYNSRQQGLEFFNGKFQLELPNSGIRLKITDGVFTLSGCNQFSFKFSLSDNGNIIFGKLSSTKQKCVSDYDRAFLINILRAQRIGVFENTIIFSSATNEQVAKAINYDYVPSGQPVGSFDPKSPIVRRTIYRLVQGQYIVSLLRSSLKKLNLIIKKQIVTFKGCNSVQFSYAAVSDGTIRFTQIGSTEKACSEDYDQYYIDAILSIRKFVASKGVYTFFDAKGKSVISFVANNTIASLIVDTAPVPSPVAPVIPVVPVIPAPIIDSSHANSNTNSNGNNNVNINVVNNGNGHTTINNIILDAGNNNLGTNFLPVVQVPIVNANDNNVIQINTKNIDNSVVESKVIDNSVVISGSTLGNVNINNANNNINGGSSSSSSSSSTASQSGSVVDTGVNTKTVLIDKPDNSNLFNQQQHSQQQNNNAQDNQQFSEDEIESIDTNQFKQLFNLTGKYEFQLPQIGFNINKNSFIFKGCNTHRLPCQFKKDKVYFGDVISTKRKCNVDHDKYFLDLIPKIFSFKREKNKCTFFNSRLQSLFTAQFPEQQEERIEKKSNDIFGFWSALIPRVNVEFDEFNVNFRGCPRERFGYKAKRSGRIGFKGGRRHKQCSVQYDDIFRDSIKSCRKFKKRDNGFSFLDVEGRERGRCFFSDW